MTDQNRVERVLDFDINAMQQRAYVGVRRAAAFLRVAERFLEEDLPRNLTLGQSVKRQFVPDPYPEEAKEELRENWRAWVTGNALRELDQFLSLFLDEAFDKVEQAKIVSGEQPPDYEWKRIDGITNVAIKHHRVLTDAKRLELGLIEDQACLVSLSKARNCLAHDLGIVTPKRATDGVLIVKWLALRTLIRQGDVEVVLEDSNMPFKSDPDGPHPSICVRLDHVERRFAVGDHMVFTADNLLDICLFYQMVIDRVAQAVAEYAQECGVVFTQRDAEQPDL